MWKVEIVQTATLLSLQGYKPYLTDAIPCRGSQKMFWSPMKKPTLTARCTTAPVAQKGKASLHSAHVSDN